MIRILLLGLVLAGVWYLYRMVTQQNAAGAASLGAANDAASVPPPASEGEAAEEPPVSEGMSAEASTEAPEQAGTAGGAASAEAEELVECPLCNAYVPERAQDGCGRPDCPIPSLAAARDGQGA